jgi:hypothetical protein
MAEIKSAVELAMERTKGLRLSHEEMEKIKEEELQAKAVGLVNRFLEVDFHLREVERELAKFDPQQRRQLERLFLQNLIEAMNLDRDNALILQGLETLLPASAWTIKKIKDLIQKYLEKKQDELRKTEIGLLAGLERPVSAGRRSKPERGSLREQGWRLQTGFEEELKS